MIYHFKDYKPSIDQSAFIAPSADVIGDVSIARNSSIWFGTVIRGDVNSITIGSNTNIQDNSVIHVDSKHCVTIGNDVTIGHNAIIHGCTIKDSVLIGMGATILDGAIIEEHVIIGAGTLVTQGKVIPKNSLVIGSPGKVIRQLTDEEVKQLKISASHYVENAKEYKKMYYREEKNEE